MIAILEDDKSIRDLVLYTLNNSKLDAIGYSNPNDFLNSLNNSIPDLLLLDIMLPDINGIDILTKLRNNTNTSKLPIILLTAKDTEYDKLIGLDSGADDYITKPFSMLELVSRINALLRRTNISSNSNNIYKYKLLVLDDNKHKVILDNNIIDLTLKEYNTLKLLLSNINNVVTRNELLVNVWGYDYIGESRTIDVHIRTIRSKLNSYGYYIETIRGVGYMIGDNNE